MNANLIIGVLIAIVIGGMIDRRANHEDQLAMDQKQYCEMVQTYIETSGRHGWQDYRGNFRRVCK